VRRIVDGSKATRVNSDNRALLDFVNREFWQHTATDMNALFGEAPIQMPLVLPAMLRGAATHAEALARLLELRKRTAPFRARKHELGRAFAAGNIPEVRALADAVSKEAMALGKLQQFAGENRFLRAVFSLGGARPVMGALGCLVAYYLKLPDDVKEVVRRRMVRPDVWCLTELAADAQAAARCLPDLLRVLNSRGLSLSKVEVAAIESDIVRLAATD
jgi:hypothetical protein